MAVNGFIIKLLIRLPARSDSRDKRNTIQTLQYTTTNTSILVHSLFYIKLVFNQSSRTMLSILV